MLVPYVKHLNYRENGSTEQQEASCDVNGLGEGHGYGRYSVEQFLHDAINILTPHRIFCRKPHNAGLGINRTPPLPRKAAGKKCFGSMRS